MKRLLTLIAAAGCTLVGGLSAPRDAQAVDTEVFFGQVVESNPPNILFILDTSRSMFSIESVAAGQFDPDATYPGTCSEDYLYFNSGTTVTTALDCPSGARIPVDSLKCEAVLEGLKLRGFAPAVVNAWRDNNSWRSVASRQYTGRAGDNVYCQGETNSSTVGFPSSGNPVSIVSGKYINFRNSLPTSDIPRIQAVKEVLAEFIEGAADTKAPVNAGLMRYYWGGSLPTAGDPPIDPDLEACEPIPDPEEDDGSALGGIMVLPIHPIGESFTFFDRMTQTTLTMPFAEAVYYKLFREMVNPTSTSQCPVQLFTPGGRSPIAASMYEALRYFGGLSWVAGNTGKIGQNYDYSSVNESLQLPENPSSSDFNNNTLYKSPIVDSLCGGRNYIVLLSDGTTELDSNSDNAIRDIGTASTGTQGLQPFPTYSGNASSPCTPDALPGQQPSNCLDDMAEYLATWGVKPPTSPGVPNTKGLVKTFTIGLSLVGSDQELKARELLQRTATRGQGLYYESRSPSDLLDVLNTVLRTILQDAASFSSPTVAVNAFNRTQNLNELYMSVFQPDFRYRWRGNLKKYKLQPIADNSTNPPTIRFGIFGTDPDIPAVDEETGFFSKVAQSFWTPSGVVDGDRVALGGAASLIPSWDSSTSPTSARKVYSNLSSSDDLTTLGNQVNASTIPDVRSLGWRPGDPYSLQQMIDWLRGRDVLDQDGDANRAESRLDMGDPLHGKPAVVLYSGTQEAPTGYVYLATNDGFLHAIPTDSGVEEWSFIPRDLLGRTRDLMFNQVVDPEQRGYGLDGSVSVLRIDRDRNGLIEPSQGDKVYLFFGQRRGGSRYYGMDVTVPSQPRLMWSRGFGDSGFDELADAWSTPSVARVRIAGANCSNGYRFDDANRPGTDCDVIVVGGGYDSLSEDLLPETGGAVPYRDSTRGRAIFMIDAYSGGVRWRAGSDSTANLRLPAMTSSIPSDVRVLELNDDGFADRMYVADLGGRLWRFDINNGNDVADLVDGGVLADLSGVDSVGARRFFAAPDVSSAPGWLNVAVGSGHREYPNSDLVTQNAFFVVRDRNKLGKIDTASYADPPVGYDDLVTVDLTSNAATVAPDAAGWKIVFSETGEKVLSESATFEGTVFFASYTPRERITRNVCSVGFGVNKLYTVNILNAARTDRNNDGVIDESDPTVVELAQSGIAPEPVFVFPSPTDTSTTCVGAECRPRPICLVGLESCGQGLSNRPVRTYWRQRGVVDAVN